MNPLVDIALTFFDSSFNSFLPDKISFSLLSKFVLLTKVAISLLLGKFPCFNLKSKISAVSSNFGVVIYLS